MSTRVILIFLVNEKAEIIAWMLLFLSRLQDEIHQKEEAENNLSAFRAVSLH